MKAMFDINVVLDIVGRREPFLTASEAAFLRAVEEAGRPMLSSHALMETKRTTLIRIFRMPELFLETSVVPMAASMNAMTDTETVSCWNEI